MMHAASTLESVGILRAELQYTYTCANTGTQYAKRNGLLRGFLKSRNYLYAPCTLAHVLGDAEGLASGTSR